LLACGGVGHCGLSDSIATWLVYERLVHPLFIGRVSMRAQSTSSAIKPANEPPCVTRQR
jgi:hypothetical protein